MMSWNYPEVVTQTAISQVH
uniref:Uncharacterized protein n=1 Tax=Oryza meridionalis TaxID=40149 RepID=A0A0E0D7J7_9ORYZ